MKRNKQKRRISMQTPEDLRLWSQKMTYKGSKAAFSVFRTVLIVGLGFLIIQPLLIKLSNSFMSMTDIYDSSVILLPKDPTLDNYKRVWNYMNFPSRLAYTIGYCVIVSFLQMLSCALTAYGLARFQYRGRGLVMAMVVFTMIVPPQTIMLPLYMTFNRFSWKSVLTLGFLREGVNLIGTPAPVLILSSFAVAFKNGLFIFMLRQYFKNIPKELEEAAYIDGYGYGRTFFRIILPGARSMLVSIFLFAFVWQWNDYYYTASLTPGMNVLSTLLPEVGSLISYADGQLTGSLQAMLYDSSALVLHILPLIILYVFAQKGFVGSIERSGLVG